MDVLQIIKSDHDRVRELIVQMEGANSKTRPTLFSELSAELKRHTKIEETYLYPEVATLASEKYPGFFDFCIANHRTIVRTLGSMQKCLATEDAAGFDKHLQSLKKVTLTHFGAEEDNLMPLLRRFVPTAEREELGVVFQDLCTSPDLISEERPTMAKKRSRA